jgi:hypothetical protein
VSRVRGDPIHGSDSKAMPAISPAAAPAAALSRAKHHSSPLDAVHMPVLPTPSPELGHPSAHAHSHQSHSSHDVFLPNHPMPSWDTMRNGQASVPTGSKRAHDGYNVDDFFTDMKKRRVAPSYDPR